MTDDLPTPSRCIVRNLASPCMTLEQAQAECAALNASTGGRFAVFQLLHAEPQRAQAEAIEAVVRRANRILRGAQCT